MDFLVFLFFTPGLYLAWLLWKHDNRPKEPVVYLKGTQTGPVSTEEEVTYYKNHPY